MNRCFPYLLVVLQLPQLQINIIMYGKTRPHSKIPNGSATSAGSGFKLWKLFCAWQWARIWYDPESRWSMQCSKHLKLQLIQNISPTHNKIPSSWATSAGSVLKLWELISLYFVRGVGSTKIVRGRTGKLRSSSCATCGLLRGSGHMLLKKILRF